MIDILLRVSDTLFWCDDNDCVCVCMCVRARARACALKYSNSITVSKYLVETRDVSSDSKIGDTASIYIYIYLYVYIYIYVD